MPRKPAIREAELTPIDDLRPHPRNYRSHPADQIAHLAQSIRDHGFYRNVVVARDGTILAGHGVVEAAREAGLTEVPVVRLAIGPDDARALKLLVADNEVGRLAEVDDRQLTTLLGEMHQDDQLLGTGYDDMMLASLLFVTRPASEIADLDEAAHWIGLPGYDAGQKPLRLIVLFDDDAARDEFFQKIGSPESTRKQGKAWSVWFPEKERFELSALSWDES